jgi:WD40 repeat protein
MMALTYSPDGKSLVAVGMDGIVTLLDPAGNRSPVPLRGHAAHVVDAAYSVDGTTLVTIDRSGLVRWWDPLVPSSCRPIAPGMRMTQQLAFDAGGDWIATAERGGQFKLWDVRTGKMIREFDSGHSNDERELGAYPSIAFAANRAMIAGGDTTSIVSVWNPTNGERLWQSQAIPLEQYGKASSFMPMDTPEIKRAVAAVEFSPDGSLLAIGHGGRNASINNYDQHVHIWATGTWAKVATLQVRNSVSRICFTPDSQELIASSHDGFMRTWRRGAQSWAGEVEFAASIGAMDLSRDGNWLAIGLVDGTLILLNRKTGRTTQRLSAHGGYISGVSFSPDAATIATSGRTDRMVKIWETARLREIHTRQVRWIPYDQRFSPKGNLLAGCYPDGVWLFPAAPLEEIDRVRGLGWPGESPTLDPGSRP